MVKQERALLGIVGVLSNNNKPDNGLAMRVAVYCYNYMLQYLLSLTTYI